jgi:hypothetical protein
VELEGEQVSIEFKGSHFERDVILWGVRWYVAYPISYRQLEEMMEERGVEVDNRRRVGPALVDGDLRRNTEGEESGTDLMEISRPDGLGDIANLGFTLSEAKLLLANVQREIAAAQARDHVVRRPVSLSPDKALLQSRCKPMGLRRMSIGGIKRDENIGILGASAGSERHRR